MKRIQIVKHSLTAIALSLAAMQASCSPKVDTGGYISESSIKDQISVGKSTRDDVKNILGSPSSQSSFGEETWYYITNRKEAYAFLKPEVVQEKVVSVHFDRSGVVSKVDDHKEDGPASDFDIVRRTTPTEGHTLGFMEQILGNIGRFNHPGNDSSAPGRKPGGL